MFIEKLGFFGQNLCCTSHKFSTYLVIKKYHQKQQQKKTEHAVRIRKETSEEVKKKPEFHQYIGDLVLVINTSHRRLKHRWVGQVEYLLCHLETIKSTNIRLKEFLLFLWDFFIYSNCLSIPLNLCKTRNPKLVVGCVRVCMRVGRCMLIVSVDTVFRKTYFFFLEYSSISRQYTHAWPGLSVPCYNCSREMWEHNHIRCVEVDIHRIFIRVCVCVWWFKYTALMR